MNSFARSIFPAGTLAVLAILLPGAQVTTSTSTSSSGSSSASASATGSAQVGQSTNLAGATQTVSGGKVFVVEFKQIGSASQQDVNRATATYTVTLNEMQKKGTLVLAGQYVQDEVIMVAFRANNEAEARDMIAKSNMMTSKLFTSFIRELKVTHLSQNATMQKGPDRAAPAALADTP